MQPSLANYPRLPLATYRVVLSLLYCSAMFLCMVAAEWEPTPVRACKAPLSPANLQVRIPHRRYKLQIYVHAHHSLRSKANSHGLAGQSLQTWLTA